MITHFLQHFQDNVRAHWDLGALTDFKGQTFTYGQMARELKRLHVLFDQVGLQKGDKVALCSRNMSRWGIAFMAVTSYEAVAVPILSDFSAEGIAFLTHHSEAKVLFISDELWHDQPEGAFADLPCVLSLNHTDYKVLYASPALGGAEGFTQRWEAAFTQAFPHGVLPEHIVFPTDNLDELAVINYTSGTSSAPKGVMLSHKALSSNLTFAKKRMPNHPGDHMVAMLPMAHMYGLAFEFLFQVCSGCHVFFLNKVPSPQILLKAFAERKPYLVITVPLVVEKIFKKAVLPTLAKPHMRVLLAVPGLSRLLKNVVKNKVLKAFGGNLNELVIGGAAINEEVERCMHDLRFPYTVGYGMTEAAPLIGYEGYARFAPSSAGKIVERMQIRVDSEDPQRIPGEFQVKGDNIMMGYFKNEEATAAAFTADGWMRTGDLGVISAQGDIYIRGRSKNMILSANGQNIYPEELEFKINNLDYVAESLVVGRDKKLVALVYPDYEALENDHIGEERLRELMQENRELVNKRLPGYAQIAEFELLAEPFEKTPKRSIKRFLYK